MNIGIIGAGSIADTVAQTLTKMPEVSCYAIAARDLARAEAFRNKHGFKKAYGSYEEMLVDENVEFVYIATPHSHHAEHMRMCIRHKKPMLCEKAFTVNAGEARAVLQEAEDAGVFCAEAIWPRYMPSRKLLADLLNSNTIGRVSALHANLFYRVYARPRITDPALCGGALLDMGIYPLNFSVMCFGEDIERIESSCVKTESGVDAMNSVTLFYRDGRMALNASGMFARSDRQGVILGEHGYILVDNVNNPAVITCYDTSDKVIKTVHVPPMLSGYEYKFRECIDSVQKGLLEPSSMPHRDTIFMMELMDTCRKQWKLVYPMEK